MTAKRTDLLIDSFGHRTSLSAGPKRALALLTVGAATAIAGAAVAKPGERPRVTLPANTRLVVRLDRTVSTGTATVGDRVVLRTSQPLALQNGATLPNGVVVYGRVTHSRRGGRIAGAPELTLRFDRVEVNGADYRIAAAPFRLRGKSDAIETAAEIGGGAVLGGIIGAVAGDAVKGAVVGAAVGTGVAVATKGNNIVLPAGREVAVRLVEPVTVLQ